MLIESCCYRPRKSTFCSKCPHGCRGVRGQDEGSRDMPVVRYGFFLWPFIPPLLGLLGQPVESRHRKRRSERNPCNSLRSELSPNPIFRPSSPATSNKVPAQRTAPVTGSAAIPMQPRYHHHGESKCVQLRQSACAAPTTCCCHALRSQDGRFLEAGPRRAQARLEIAIPLAVVGTKTPYTHHAATMGCAQSKPKKPESQPAQNKQVNETPRPPAASRPAASQPRVSRSALASPKLPAPARPPARPPASVPAKPRTPALAARSPAPAKTPTAEVTTRLPASRIERRFLFTFLRETFPKGTWKISLRNDWYIIVAPRPLTPVSIAAKDRCEGGMGMGGCLGPSPDIIACAEG